MAESSSAETSTSSNFSGSSTNFSAYISETESDSEANSNEAGPSSRVVSFLDRLTVYTDVCKIIIKFIIQLIFLQQYFPIPVPCNITRYCTGSYCTGPEAIYAQYPSNQRAL